MRFAGAALLIILNFGPAAAAPVRRGDFDVETLAPGIHVYRNVSAGFPGANSLVVERADGLLVVDAQPSPAAGRALLAALALGGKKPVRYLVLSHPHAEACGGASAFPEGTLVIASDAARVSLEDAAYDMGAEIRARAEPGWVEPKRVLPVLHASAPMTLDDPSRKVVLYPLPRAHSRGDLWVDLPGTGVIAVGGLLVSDRNPYGGDCDVRGWIGALNELARDDITALVPSRGPAVGVEAVRSLRDALAWTRGRVQEAFTDLVPSDEVVGQVMADPDLGRRFDPLAKPSFARTVVSAAFEATMADRKRRGMP
jgi:glyoxylase-like metal-dependent hydrolase (beta-lactamase superfamily II)